MNRPFLAFLAFLLICAAGASRLDQSIYEASPHYDVTVDAAAFELGGG